MKRLKQNLKKGMAFVLSLAMVAGVVPAMSSESNAVQAANDTGKAPSVSAYATKEQLMDDTFAPDANGIPSNIGKVVWGKKKNSDDTYSPLEWYILGKDDSVTADNTIIFAASPIETNQAFSSSASTTTYSYKAGTGYGDTDGSNTVYSNHYGASDLREKLRSIEGDQKYLTYSRESRRMNFTTVTTKDIRNNVTYTIKDTMYVPEADGRGAQTIKVGNNNQTVLAGSVYWNSGDSFWLRSPVGSGGGSVMVAKPGSSVTQGAAISNYDVRPASSLNLTSVFFASSATAATDTASDTVSGTIQEGTAMIIRRDGGNKNIGAAIYNAEAGTIKVRRGSTTYAVSLVVQGKGTVDGEEKDWYYSKKIDEEQTVNASEIQSALNLSSDIDLSACKIWLEINDTEPHFCGVSAVCADREIETINTTYATKEQLMNSFKPYGDGTAVNYGKIVFGKKNNSDNTFSPLEWYILGKDDGVSGDNTIIFAASPIATGQVLSASTREKTYQYEPGTDYANSDGSKLVHPNHYGASDLRVALQGMSEDSNYFTEAEQDLMNPTTVTTLDILRKDREYQRKDDVPYTTADKLYALIADSYFSYSSPFTTIKAGSNDSTVLAMSSYWGSGDIFWLRSPMFRGDNPGMVAKPGKYVNFGLITSKYAVQPASNLDLSSVLFASAATAASSGAISGMIEDDTALTLRLDGSGKDIGAVTYNVTTGDIKAMKGSVEGDVAVVVQGNDGTNDWYYSKQITGTEVVNVTDIVSETYTPASIDLSDCKIWLEIAYTDGSIYAVNATEVLSITSVEITGIETPAAATTLDTEASCATTGVSSITPQITWSPSDATAGYNTSYTASITLTADEGYEFIDSTTATVLGDTATGVTKNEDGTKLTVTYDFSATAKRKIVSVTAPTVPETFSTYYGYEGYAASPISGSGIELGTQATVIFEGTVEPTAANMDVIWTVESAGGGAYNKTPGAENTFRWTIPKSALTNYNATECANYDSNTGTITGTVEITNKAALPVTITGTDKGIAYTGATIDVSQYFNIDPNAGTATYSLVTGEDGGTGEGSLDGAKLTVTKTGTFKIKVETAANGIYAVGEETITLTIDKGTTRYTTTDYSGTYDGQAHSISVNVSSPEGTTITYSTDGENYDSDKPSFRDEGLYIVYYRITKGNYTTIEGSETVTINKKSATITAKKQNIAWGNEIDQSKYTKDGLVSGDTITEITLTPSTTALTENGTISISGVKIENAAGEDVTGNYDMTPVNGILKIAHNTMLAPDRIESVKVKTTYAAGDTLNVDDITVTAYYKDGYSESVTGFTTNLDGIDMNTAGTKTLTVSYTKNGETKTDDISITVNSVPVTEYIITATAGANGTISPDGDVKVAAGGSQTFTISPSSGYVIDTLKVDGLEVTATTSYTFSDLNANHTIEVTFKKESRTPDPVDHDNSDDVNNNRKQNSGKRHVGAKNHTVKEDTSDNSNDNQNDSDNNDSNPVASPLPDDNNGKKVPQTRDKTSGVWLIIVSIISGTGLILIVMKCRKNYKISKK